LARRLADSTRLIGEWYSICNCELEEAVLESMLDVLTVFLSFMTEVLKREAWAAIEEGNHEN